MQVTKVDKLTAASVVEEPVDGGTTEGGGEGKLWIGDMQARADTL